MADLATFYLCLHPHASAHFLVIDGTRAPDGNGWRATARHAPTPIPARQKPTCESLAVSGTNLLTDRFRDARFPGRTTACGRTRPNRRRSHIDPLLPVVR